MQSKIVLITCAILLGAAITSHTAPPRGASLREIWQGARGQCGILEEAGGIYELKLADQLPRDTCIISVGSDVVVLAPGGGQPQKWYTVVPLARITLTTFQ
jgi:hypothetical protein